MFLLILFIIPLNSFSIYGQSTDFNHTYKINIHNNDELKPTENKFFIHGQKTGKIYYEIYSLLNKKFEKSIERNIKNDILKNATPILLGIEKSCPSFFEEIRGLAKSTNIDMKKLIALGQYISIIFGESCTSTIITGNATIGDQTYLTQNIDTKYYDPDILLLRSIFTNRYRIHIGNGYSYVFLGIPILYEYPLLNEKGLGFGANGLALTQDPLKQSYIDHNINGTPTYCLERITMRECSNVIEVAEFWKSANRSSDKNKKYPRHWDFSSSLWCDKEGGILVIEQTHNYIKCVFSDPLNTTDNKSDILWHANHHQWLSPNKTGSKSIDECKTSHIRAARAKEILDNEDNYGNIDLEFCINNITRDHEGGTNPKEKDSADICRHPDQNDSHLTAFSWIISPKELKFYFTRWQPCSNFTFLGRFRKFRYPYLIVFINNIINNLNSNILRFLSNIKTYNMI